MSNQQQNRLINQFNRVNYGVDDKFGSGSSVENLQLRLGRYVTSIKRALIAATLCPFMHFLEDIVVGDVAEKSTGARELDEGCQDERRTDVGQQDRGGPRLDARPPLELDGVLAGFGGDELATVGPHRQCHAPVLTPRLERPTQQVNCAPLK